MKRLEEIIPPTNNFNRHFLDLLRKIFVFDPKKRITAREALKHPWFTELVEDDGTEAGRIKLERDRVAQLDRIAERKRVVEEELAKIERDEAERERLIQEELERVSRYPRR